MIFEPPAYARSWQEDCTRDLSQMEGMIRTDCDMFQYGMNVGQEGPNQKTTGIMTNSEEVAKRMSTRCRGQHEHSPLMGVKALRAQTQRVGEGHPGAVPEGWRMG